ncbi:MULTISPECIES: 5'-3'-deoxyribonucleotidase [Paraliobacillus]|uniref:5' nucleotidase, NT5C type n=2 Tax=Bacillaceae TaxID=186817 RepID=UPI000DD394C5|nr:MULTISPECIES: 5'-3'-deoxyribonucleotidase [Paraliobacillus]
MKRIAIDMDEVIADALSKHVSLYNQKYNEHITSKDLNGTNLTDLRPELKEEIDRLIADPLFFRDLGIIKDSVKVIRELMEHYQVFIVTAAMEFPPSFNAKYEWLKEHFGFLNDLNFVFCGDKSIINADYLIDDNVRHFKHFIGQGIVFTSPHNINETGYVRVSNWKEVREYFLENK